MKYIKKIDVFVLTILFCFLSCVVYAAGSSNENGIPITVAIILEMFLSFPMAIGFFNPLSKAISPTNPKKIFLIMFIIRILFLLFVDFYATTLIVLFDFYILVVGIVGILPRVKRKCEARLIKKITMQTNNNNNNFTTVLNTRAINRCEYCNSLVKDNIKFCEKCGAPVKNALSKQNTENNSNASNNNELENESDLNIVEYSWMGALSEDDVLKKLISDEMKNIKFDISNKLPSDMVKKKKILKIIFAILVFVYV